MSGQVTIEELRKRVETLEAEVRTLKNGRVTSTELTPMLEQIEKRLTDLEARVTANM
jgi:hypothetical protein